jgi:hypothetical protein
MTGAPFVQTAQELEDRITNLEKALCETTSYSDSYVPSTLKPSDEGPIRGAKHAKAVRDGRAVYGGAVDRIRDIIGCKFYTAPPPREDVGSDRGCDRGRGMVMYRECRKAEALEFLKAKECRRNPSKC